MSRAAPLLLAALFLPLAAAEKAPLEQLWEPPQDLSSRDLFHGPGGTALAPADGPFRFVSEDREGHSGGYEVIDAGGRHWDVKIGEEAQAELVVSRILWAVGFHQPVTYYVDDWRMTGGPTGHPAPGRFRLESDHEKEGDWPWRRNPFSGTQPLHGLFVINVLLDNWDLDSGQNRIYTMDEDVPGPRRRYVVQDLGAALGKPSIRAGTRNDVDGYERTKFILGVSEQQVHLALQWRHPRLRGQVRRDDVVWACRLLAGLSPRQMDDAFRAAGYSESVRGRFIRKIQEKIREGLALEGPL
ncbi:MAG TPA: hypothetical protein VFV75_08240 [Candidatus Polarisedimenticolaceae bacterium]|nr:hypothetical protein [Candidatus Polarisedimenticolaceae bacterium]